jgi:hypothetical protein
MSFLRPRIRSETEEAYRILLESYPSMIQGHGFDIYYSTWEMSYHHEQLMKEKGHMIKHAVFLWIVEEHRSGRLLDRERWGGFPEAIHGNWIDVGYRHLFSYESYRFQLVIEPVEHCFHLNLYDMCLSESMDVPESVWDYWN